MEEVKEEKGRDYDFEENAGSPLFLILMKRRVVFHIEQEGSVLIHILESKVVFRF